LLDVGSGNHSAKKMKLLFPGCEYYGLDKVRDYNYNEEDFTLMKGFYQLDLTELTFTDIPDNYFDVIILSHVIEHLFNGDLVLEKLLTKLKSNGFIYVEYPGIKSTQLPSMKGTLNFFDDITHIRIYNLKEIFNLLLRNGILPIKGGTRRNWRRIFLMPLMIPARLMRNGFLIGSDFWDLLGFAEYVIGRKTQK
jgi:SAM-dependent methyltransferase